MARKPLETELDPIPVAELPQDIAQAVHDMTAIESAYSEDRDLLNQLLGQAQMAGAFEEFSRTVRTSKLAYVKENKLYRALSGSKTPHGAEFLKGTWEEFCGLLGRSVDQVDRDIKNLQEFGEEALESMSRMGIGYREMRQFRRLPEDQKTALIEVAKLGDKESFIELAEEIITKHSKEKEALTKRVTEIEEDAAAKDRLIASKNERLDTLETELGKKRAAQAEPDAVLADLHVRLIRDVDQTVAHISATIRSYFAQVFDHHEAHGGQRSDALLLGAIDQMHRALIILKEDFGLVPPPTDDGIPEWERWHNERDAALAAAQSAPTQQGNA